MTAPSPEGARLAVALRELKARTGLSLVGLAAKTAFSKSSWDRYLNGRTLPPRDAVQDLCRLAGEPEGRCLALWEIAEAQCSGRAAPPRPSRASPAARAAPTSPSARGSTAASVAASPCASSSAASAASAAVPAAPSAREVTGAGGAGDDSAVQRSAAALAVLASVCAAVAVGVAAVALLLPHGDGGPRWSLSPPAAAGPRCREAACEGESPMRMKCASAPVTLASHRTAGGASLELRYSEECGTSWARMWGTRVGDRVELTAAGIEGRDSRSGPVGRVRSAEVRDAVDADAYVYTPMAAVEPGAVVRACFRPAAAGEGECFGGRVTR